MIVITIFNQLLITTFYILLGIILIAIGFGILNKPELIYLSTSATILGFIVLLGTLIGNGYLYYLHWKQKRYYRYEIFLDSN